MINHPVLDIYTALDGFVSPVDFREKPETPKFRPGEEEEREDVYGRRGITVGAQMEDRTHRFPA